MNNTWWTILKIIGLAAVLLMVIGVLLELILAAVWPAPPVDHTPLVEVEPHPVLAYRLVPGQRTFSYAAPVQTDDFGLREIPTTPHGDTLLFLGGSETFGKGVRAEDTFSALVGADLETHVVDAGVPDYNIDQSVLWLERYGARFTPRRVVLVAYWNDLFEEPGLDPSAQTSSTARPSEWAPRTALTRRGLLRYVAPIYTRSRLLYELRNRLKTVVGRWRSYPEQRWRDALVAGETLPELERAWARFDRALAQFAALANKRGFEPLVVVLPIEHTIEGDLSTAPFVDEATRRARGHGLVVVDASAALAAAQGARPYIPWDGRPAPAGHRAIADVIVRYYQQTPR